MTTFTSILMITFKMECKTRNFHTTESFTISIYTPIYSYCFKMTNEQSILSCIFLMKFKLTNSFCFITYSSTMFLSNNRLCTSCFSIFYIYHNSIKFLITSNIDKNRWKCTRKYNSHLYLKLLNEQFTQHQMP